MRKCTTIILTVIIGLTIILNAMAWKSTAFCDYYTDAVFPAWQRVYGSLTGFSSYSIGELMIALFVILLAAAVILGFVAVIFFIAKHTTHNKHSLTRQPLPIIRKFTCIYYRFLFAAMVLTAFIVTLNYTIFYHGSTFRDKYLADMLLEENDDYTVEELASLRDYVVMRANEYAKTMERDENGLIIYHGNMEEEAIRSMQNLGKQYPQLQGYYSIPKQMRSSDFVSQQHMRGYYFPFSMEANYNTSMYIMEQPSTMCHELAHTKGFMYEDEANLIGFLACIHSDDPVFQYSGYLSVLNYINNDFKKSIGGNDAVYRSHVKISGQVKDDNVFLTEDAWQKVEQKAVIKTETVKKASSAFIDTNLILNGVEEGRASYCEVVGLLMDYYTCSSDELGKKEEYMAATQ